MDTSHLLNKIFFLNRATFGFSPSQWDFVNSTEQKQVIQVVIQDSNAFHPIGKMEESLDAPLLYDFRIVKPLSPELRRSLNQQNVEKIKELTMDWLGQMVHGKEQLREKTALFWHGHFACRMQNAYYQQNLLNDIRKNALGNFKDLLFSVSKSAAMLNFLNNQQNKKAHPNENFAREVMELFTLGRGNYSETDIKEAARAFTGWEYDKDGNFQFNEKVHYTGVKTFRGKSGNFSGEDILNMILEDKTTAKFITTKVYRYFVNETIDEGQVNKLAEKFYTSGYSITTLLEEIFSSHWFYSDKNKAAIIKSPIELIAGIQRNLPMKVSNPQSFLTYTNALGQQAFYPPNVAGWPGGTNWIDASTLMLRLRIPRLIDEEKNIQINTKTDDDIQMGMAKKKPKNGNAILANIDMSEYDFLKEENTEDKKLELLSLLLFGRKNKNLSLSIVEEGISKKEKNEDPYKSMIIALMGTPEYQLC